MSALLSIGAFTSRRAAPDLEGAFETRQRSVSPLEYKSVERRAPLTDAPSGGRSGASRLRRAEHRQPASLYLDDTRCLWGITA